MAYILNKTNGAVVTTLSNGSIDKTTDLTFVGKNYAGYGEVINEDLLRLLENFANGSPPSKPITGELWYDTSSQILKFYDGSTFRGLAVSATVSGDAPAYSTLNAGDFWWDSAQQVLKVFNGTDFVSIGPKISGLDNYLMFNTVVDNTLNPETNTHVVAEHKIFNQLVAVVSSSTFHISTDYTPDDDLVYDQDKWHWIRKGITLVGADRLTGVSSNGVDGGSMLWGTAADALAMNGMAASTASIATTIVARSNTGSIFVNNISANGNVSSTGSISAGANLSATGSLTVGGVASIGSDTTVVGNVTATVDMYATIFHGTATAAQYADLAERYAADAVYEEGTVLVIGGLKEVTVTNEHANIAVAGIVSKKPAFMMNSEAGNDETHPYIALKGRIPCKVLGPVKKGDILVTSSTPGYAQSADLTYAVHPAAIIGKALENFEGFSGLVEVKV